MEYQLTISEACKKHDAKHSTLNLWVKNGKVASEKRKIGRKEVYFINEQSLLVQMKRSKAATKTPAKAPDQSPKTEGKSEQEPEKKTKPQPDTKEPEKSESDSDKKRHPRNRPRSNVAVTRAKGAMRSLDQDELIRVNSWLARRILDRSPSSQKRSAPHR